MSHIPSANKVRNLEVIGARSAQPHLVSRAKPEIQTYMLTTLGARSAQPVLDVTRLWSTGAS